MSVGEVQTVVPSIKPAIRSEIIPQAQQCETETQPRRIGELLSTDWNGGHVGTSFQSRRAAAPYANRLKIY